MHKTKFLCHKSRLDKKTFSCLLSLRNFVLCSFRFYMFYVNCCLSFSIPLPSAYSGANSVRGKCAMLLPLLSENKQKTFCVSISQNFCDTSMFWKFWLDFEGFIFLLYLFLFVIQCGKSFIFLPKWSNNVVMMSFFSSTSFSHFDKEKREKREGYHVQSSVLLPNFL